MEWTKRASELFSYTQALRRDFHRHPELGLEEFRTSEIVAKELKSFGLKVATGIGKTGVVGLLETGKPGPVVLLRFDMDALPIQEETGAEYASENPGRMHACGHDSHMAIGLTVAKMLKEAEDELCGTVKFMFQPAEEGLGGAERMIADGVLENPKPDVALSCHVWNVLPVGDVIISEGPLMAGSAVFTAVLTGRGGHGASPHESIDPVIAAAQCVTAVQSIVSRNVSPLQSAVISVTSIHAGEAFNVIPQQATLKGTIRFFEPDVRATVERRFEEVLRGVAGAMGCSVELTLHDLTPAVINDPQVTEWVSQAVKQTVPELNQIRRYQTMGSEDFSYVQDRIPGCFVFFGTANEEKGLVYGHHHPKFDIDETALPSAAACMAAATQAILQRGA